MAHLPQITRFGFVDDKAGLENAEKYVQLLHTKKPSVHQLCRNLSGGNQQKVVLAKWLCNDVKVQLVDEPTRGIDVGAKFEIYKLMTDIVKEQRAVVMVSSELPELLGMCDRIYIMCQGRITGCVERNEFSQETIMKYAAGLGE